MSATSSRGVRPDAGPGPSAVARLSDDIGETIAALNPTMATAVGWPGYDHLLDDYTPDGHAARLDAYTSARRQAGQVRPTGPADELALDVLLERLDALIGEFDGGWAPARLNVMDCPSENVRQSFDLLALDTTADQAVALERMRAVPVALAGYREGLLYAAEGGRVSAARQVRRCRGRCRIYAHGMDGTGAGYFRTDLSGRAGGAPSADWERAAAAADSAYAELADFLDEQLLPRAPAADVVGAERYRLGSRQHLGISVDLDETYTWGWEEFLRLRSELREVVAAIAPGRTPAEAAAVLDRQPRYQLTGTAGLQEWMQELSDRSLAELGRSSFEVPAELRALQCRIAPAGGGIGAYYTSPTDDFSRPGSMWFSVDPDQATFPSWRDTSTVFHEGVPGHHLQIATAVLRRDRLNAFQRLFACTSGHCEGWALYAERLMRELGWFADEGDLLGHLNAQLFRAARVVLDIGMHLELEIPSGTGFAEGRRWTPELGLEFLSTQTLLPQDEAADEIDRYLGWPGQAPAYKVGERIWLAGRDEARTRHGDAFDPRAFHSAALDLGNMGLGPLGAALARL